jgi:PhnB protein
MKNSSSNTFAPVLYLRNVAKAIDFYSRAFDAKEMRRWTNDDGSIHVAEMQIGESLFHLHEETPRKVRLSPETLGGTCVELGLFVKDPDEVMKKALDAGAAEASPMQDYEYGYRQGSITDPFEHQWTIQKAIAM